MARVGPGRQNTGPRGWDSAKIAFLRVVALSHKALDREEGIHEGSSRTRVGTVMGTPRECELCTNQIPTGPPFMITR